MEAETGMSTATIRRRELLVAGAGAGLALAAPLNYAAIARAKRVPLATDGKFAYGVASGFPSPKAITLWTRLDGIDRSSKLELEVATDKNFKKVVKSGSVVAKKGSDYTARALVKGLKPGEEYFYRFATEKKSSKVGHFRTLPPANSKQKLRIGFYSCQSYEAGYFNAPGGLAKEKDLDFVICLGDYIYERHFWDGPADRHDTTGANGDGNVQTLEEYREKYRFYQRDKQLQAMHAAHPFISVWDDHEVEDNYAGDEVDSAQPDPNLENNGDIRRVPFLERRANGYKSFFEAMPRIQKASAGTTIYGSIPLGGIAELFLTDERQYRDPQPCNDELLAPCAEADDPGRKYLGDEQKAWFKSAVAGSKATWKMWAARSSCSSATTRPSCRPSSARRDSPSTSRGLRRSRRSTSRSSDCRRRHPST